MKKLAVSFIAFGEKGGVAGYYIKKFDLEKQKITMAFIENDLKTEYGNVIITDTREVEESNYGNPV